MRIIAIARALVRGVLADLIFVAAVLFCRYWIGAEIYSSTLFGYFVSIGSIGWNLIFSREDATRNKKRVTDLQKALDDATARADEAQKRADSDRDRADMAAKPKSRGRRGR